MALRSFKKKVLRISLFYDLVIFICTGALPVRVPDTWNWSYKQLLATIWVLGVELGPLEEKPELLTPEPSLQPA